MHLLTETSIFVQLPNECFCQVTGEPLITLNIPTDTLTLPPATLSETEPIRTGQVRPLKRKRNNNELSERPRKRLRGASSNSRVGKSFEAVYQKT